MSTNIHFIAHREVKVIKTNRVSVQQIQFDELQTPTRVTHEIMASADRPQAYKDWVLRECSRDEEFPIYAEDDVFGEGDPVGVEIYNAGKEHIEKFEEWLKMCEEEGFEVRAEAW